MNRPQTQFNPSGSSSASSGSTTSNLYYTFRILFGFLLIICLILGLYLGVMWLWWYFDGCKNKKPFWQFVLDFENMTPCNSPTNTPMSETGAELDYDKREILQEKEVFHIADQIYNYNQAKHKCKAYGARLATKNEITEAYNKGANWCSYGWSDKQSAYYPVQRNYWRRNRGECRHPGVVGGFFDNKHLKFGANCYGVKPEGRVVLPKKPSYKDIPFCKRPENKKACERLDKDHIDPWNRRIWSEWK